MKVVLDANIYISSLISTLGSPKKIVELWENNQFEVLITEEIINEIGRVLRYPKIVKRHKKDEPAIERYLELLITQATLVENQVTLNVVDDESDNRYLECAVSGGAHFVVSGDNHLLTIGQYEGVVILNPAAFILLIGKGEGGRP